MGSRSCRKSLTGLSEDDGTRTRNLRIDSRAVYEKTIAITHIDLITYV
jgi:hypothetical protein